MRIASFNVENLFDRAKAFGLQDESARRAILEQYARINELFDQPAYSQADKAEMVELLAKLGLAQRDDGGDFVTHNAARSVQESPGPVRARTDRNTGARVRLLPSAPRGGVMAREVPRPFQFHWGGGQIVDEASYMGKYTEPSIQLLEYERAARTASASATTATTAASSAAR